MIVVTNVIFSTILAIGRSYAQSAEAESLFNEGNKLMTEGKLVQACEAFEASNRVEPRAGALIRLGECREQNQQLASAWSAYRDARNLATDPRKRQFATAKAAMLEPQLSYLTVTVSDPIRIRGLAFTRNGAPFDSMLWNRALPVDGGDYTIVGRAPGYETWKKIVHVSRDRAKITIEVPILAKANGTAPPEPPPLQPSSSPSSTTPGSSTPPPTPTSLSAPTVIVPVTTVVQQNLDATLLKQDDSHRESKQAEPVSAASSFPRKYVAIGIGSAGVIASGVGLWFGVKASSSYGAARDLCGSNLVCGGEDNYNKGKQLISDARSDAMVATVLVAGGGAAIIGGAVLFLTAPHVQEHAIARVVPVAHDHGAGVAVLGRF